MIVNQMDENNAKIVVNTPASPQTSKKSQTICIKDRKSRVIEGVTLLKKLHELGVHGYVAGLDELKATISTWVDGGPAWSGSIQFPSFGRVAELVLPERDGRVATLAFKIVR